MMQTFIFWFLISVSGDGIVTKVEQFTNRQDCMYVLDQIPRKRKELMACVQARVAR